VWNVVFPCLLMPSKVAIVIADEFFDFQHMGAYHKTTLMVKKLYSYFCLQPVRKKWDVICWKSAGSTPEWTQDALPVHGTNLHYRSDKGMMMLCVECGVPLSFDAIKSHHCHRGWVFWLSTYGAYHKTTLMFKKLYSYFCLQPVCKKWENVPFLWLSLSNNNAVDNQPMWLTNHSVSKGEMLRKK
jgi:hypothetical protein